MSKQTQEHLTYISQAAGGVLAFAGAIRLAHQPLTATLIALGAIGIAAGKWYRGKLG